MIILIHMIWISFLILGFPVFLILNAHRWRIVHAAAMLITVVMQLTGTLCPLTILEDFFESRMASGRFYEGDFIARLMQRWIYVDQNLLKMITCLTVIYTGAVLLSFLVRPPRWKTQENPDG